MSMLFEIMPFYFVLVLISIEVLISYELNILSSTIYLHRYLTHTSVKYMHPRIIRVFRFCIWLYTGMIPRVWVAIHRIHHANTDESRDPHSPWIYGIWYIGLFQAIRYHFAAKELKDSIEEVTKDILADKRDRLYVHYHWLGVVLLLLICLASCYYSPWGLFWGWVPGFIVWLLHVLVTPIAGGFVNGLGHWNKSDPIDRSRNVVERDYFIGGELLHKNHHKYPWSAKFEHLLTQLDPAWHLLNSLASRGWVKGLVCHDDNGNRVIQYAS